jgi:hypothetical protein
MSRSAFRAVRVQNSHHKIVMLMMVRLLTGSPSALADPPQERGCYMSFYILGFMALDNEFG